MGLRVLIIDDALFMRSMLKDVFIKAGHTVVGEADNGLDALARFRELQPDLVTMDIVMPKRSGIEALQDIMAEAPSARVIMVSALGQDSLIFEAVQSGARDFIVKPFDEQRVLEVVNRVTNQAR